MGLFGYLTFYNFADVKNKNIFAFDVPRTPIYIFINLCVSFSVLLSTIVTFKPTKDILMTYFNIEYEVDRIKVNKICTIFLLIITILSASILVLYDIQFIDIINFMTLCVMPTICIYLPFYYYSILAEKKHILIGLGLMMVLNIYFLKLTYF